MAQARASQRKPTRLVTLRMTEGEADLVLALVTSIHGSKSKSPRKYAQRIAAALTSALGYSFADTDAYHLMLGTVTMFNYDDHPDIHDGDRAMAHLTSAGYQLHSAYYLPPELRDALAGLSELIAALAVTTDDGDASLFDVVDSGALPR